MGTTLFTGIKPFTPTQAMDEINLTISQFDNASIAIYNTMGECVHRQIVSSSNSLIDATDLNAGVYFINIKTEQGTTTKTVIINK